MRKPDFMVNSLEAIRCGFGEAAEYLNDLRAHIKFTNESVPYVASMLVCDDGLFPPISEASQTFIFETPDRGMHKLVVEEKENILNEKDGTLIVSLYMFSSGTSKVYHDEMSDRSYVSTTEVKELLLSSITTKRHGVIHGDIKDDISLQNAIALLLITLALKNNDNTRYTSIDAAHVCEAIRQLAINASVNGNVSYDIFNLAKYRKDMHNAIQLANEVAKQIINVKTGE